jgi:O-antigen/teichoic acid export membrane protein
MVIQMVVSIIVARQLSPDDFGVMAIMTFFTSVALTIVDSGFSQTLIRKSEASDEEYSSVFGFNVITSLLLYLLLLLLAEPLARFYGNQVIADISPILLLVLPINALCVVQTVMFTREFRFALLSKVVFVASLISGVVAVVMALLGFGIWSLVAQRLLAMGVKAAAFWVIRRWRFTPHISVRSLAEMAPFSLRLLATDLISSIYNNVAQLFIGKMHSTGALGYYSQAQKLKDLPVTSTVQAVQGVTYPALSKIANDETKFRYGYLRIMRLLSFAMFPAMLIFVAIAPDMFRLLLGEKWMPTVPYFEILALSGLFYPLAIVSYNVLKVKSDGKIIVRLEVIKRAIMTAVLCYTIPQSVEAIGWGMMAMAAVEFALNTGVALRYIERGTALLLRTIAPSFGVAVVMYIILHLQCQLLADMHMAMRLCVMIVTGSAIYLTLSWAFDLRALRESMRVLREVLAKSE